MASRKVRIVGAGYTSATRAAYLVDEQRSAEWADAEKRSIAFRKIGQAISSVRYVTDPNVGITQAHPWKVVKGATGFYGLQLDTRTGYCIKPAGEK